MKKEEFESSILDFKTNRLSLDQMRDGSFINIVKNILTTEVTKHLPDGWQSISSNGEINNWIKERDHESCFLNIRKSNKIVGFCFLFLSEAETRKLDIRFGYLLAEESWGQGLGTEFILGLVKYCHGLRYVNSISGGVERQNLGSIRVLEKTGFVKESINGDTIFYQKQFH